MFYLGKSSKVNLIGVDPRWFEIINLALKITLVDFGIPKDGGLRTGARQNEMYLDPGIKTNCDGIKDRSKHQTGLAVDVFAYVDRRASWDELHLTHIAAAILQAASSLGYIVYWGGFFKPGGWDKPHFVLQG